MPSELEQKPPKWLSDLPLFPIGDGHHVGWTSEGDLWWWHPNCHPDGSGSLGTIDVTSGTRHRLTSKEPLTINGSLLCRGCNAHGFVTDGKWVGV